MMKYCIFASFTLFMAALSGCTRQSAGEIRLTGTRAALPTMEHLALNANRCWFRSADKNFRLYRLAPELQSFSDRPRILVVPRENPGGRPLLVIEAGSDPARVTAYGPLMQTAAGKRIGTDLRRWIKGDERC